MIAALDARLKAGHDVGVENAHTHDAQLSLASSDLAAPITMLRACRAGTSAETPNFLMRRRIYMRKR